MIPLGIVAGAASAGAVPPAGAYLGAVVSEPGNSSSIAVQMPAVVAAGDLLVIQHLNRSNSTPTTPSGWTSTHTAVLSTALRQTWFTRVADGSEGGGTVTITTSGSSGRGAICHRIAAGSYGGYGVSSATGTTTNPNPPSRTSGFGAVPTLWIAGVAFRPAPDVTAFPLSGHNAGVSADAITNTFGIYSCTTEASSASLDPGEFTLDAAPTHWVGSTLSIQLN